jgi:hypothetical protein
MEKVSSAGTPGSSGRQSNTESQYGPVSDITRSGGEAEGRRGGEWKLRDAESAGSEKSLRHRYK